MIRVFTLRKWQFIFDEKTKLSSHEKIFIISDTVYAFGDRLVFYKSNFDMNSKLQTQDKNNIWNVNSGVASQVP
ncbi:MAG: hypothetical protein EA361_09230 [Bacteroidetes bacterium]|nr:MAG: hypothetical protein EA361_09230 [Bacteroidota bacterium]